ncbi:transmembrane prediction [Stieleria sp. TO1_6]|uniref:transmembrane prediction n=1 Tax=Stieleria tagensis TaxID=2956795 RepID=UPI00209B94E0|nr:transmembrane prediction [Stieleria tagensis]MCO8120884.1 transmembrane prediction [Stieleria tagensis]
MKTTKPAADGLLSSAKLWTLTFAPLCWAAHFLASYLTSAIYCAKYAPADGDGLPIRIAVALFTVIALSLIAWIGGIGLRAHHMGETKLPHDDNTSRSEQRFLGFATLLLSLLSGVAILFTALVFVIMETCH